MGFNSVYRALQDVFPEVDARLLRAVAIEHSKDADAAVEAILVEVIPYLSQRFTAPSSNGNEIFVDAKVAVEDKDVTSGTGDAFLADAKGLDEKLNDSAYYDAHDGHSQLRVDCANEGIISLGKYEESRVNVGAASSSTSMAHDNASNDDHDYDQERRNIEIEETVSVGKCQDSSAKIGSDGFIEMAATTTAHCSVTQQGDCINDILSAQFEEFDGLSAFKTDTPVHGESHRQLSTLDGNPQELEVSSAFNTDTPVHGESHHQLSSLDGNSQELEVSSAINTNTAVYGESHHQLSSLDGNSQELVVSVAQLAPSPVPELTPSAQESSPQLVALPDSFLSGCENLEPCDSSDATSKEESSLPTHAGFEDESTLNTIATRSGQICRIDLLENIIEDARCNKKILFSAMESVLGLMKEVELQERAAEQAKEDAANGGLEILSRVEDLKKMLSHAKEANDMHAGEVYGEKSILATEARELQSRLLGLSDERDKSLAILKEMHNSIEARLGAAEMDRKAAEQEKLEKEESARKALAEQELIMDKVVEESKILKQEAEENSKLREFLMDRGHVVDMLQGEISVICQDVKLLKEKFDNRVPLSQSLSSSQTSCILASSSSSQKSTLADQVPELAENPKKTSLSASMDEAFFSGEETTTKDYHNALVDDDWELFDNRDIYA